MRRDLAYADFAPLVNGTFWVVTDGQPAIPLTLIDVRPLKPIVRKEAFDLRFKCAAPLAQQTYWMRHDTLGTVQIFIVPIARTEDGYIFRSVFQ